MLGAAAEAERSIYPQITQVTQITQITQIKKQVEFLSNPNFTVFFG